MLKRRGGRQLGKGQVVRPVPAGAKAGWEQGRAHTHSRKSPVFTSSKMLLLQRGHGEQIPSPGLVVSLGECNCCECECGRTERDDDENPEQVGSAGTRRARSKELGPEHGGRVDLGICAQTQWLWPISNLDYQVLLKFRFELEIIFGNISGQRSLAQSHRSYGAPCWLC